MIRIPINRIENIDIDLAEFTCSQCKLLLIPPFFQCIKCNFKYCEECTQKIMGEKKNCYKCGGDKDLIQEGNNNLDLDKLKVKCLNFIHGCNIACTYNNFTDLNKHQVKCDYKMIKCGICKTVEYIQKESKQHEDVCPEVQISCVKCKSEFKRKNLEEHNKSECIYILFSCLHCKSKISLISMKEHSIRCKPVKVKCQACGLGKLKNHECIFDLLNKISKFQKKNDLWMKFQKEDQQDILSALEKIKMQVEFLKSDCYQNANKNTIDIKESIAELLTQILKIYEEQEKRNKEDILKVFNSFENLQNNINNNFDVKIQEILNNLTENLKIIYKYFEENKQEIKTNISNLITTEISLKLNDLNNNIIENRNSISKETLAHKNEISNLIIVEISSKLNPLDNEIKENGNSIAGMASTAKNEFNTIKSLINDQGLKSEQKFQEIKTSNDNIKQEITFLRQITDEMKTNMINEFNSLRKEYENQNKKFCDEAKKNEEHFTNIQNGIQEINTEGNLIKKELNEVKKNSEEQLIKIQNGIAGINTEAQDIKKELNEVQKKSDELLIKIQNGISGIQTETNKIKEQTTNIHSSISSLNDEHLKNIKLNIEKIEEINKNFHKKFDEISIMNLLTLFGTDKSANSYFMQGIQTYLKNRNFNKNPYAFNSGRIIYEKFKTLGQEIISNFVGSKFESNQNSELSIIENELIPQVTSKLEEISSLSLKVCKNPKNISYLHTKSDFYNYLKNWKNEFACNFIFTEEIYNTKEQIEKNQYLYYIEFDENSKKLILHLKNLKSLSIIRKELYNHDSTSYYFDGIFHKNKYFCCGGKIQEEYLNICSIFSLENQTLENSIKLNEQKSCVSLISTTNYIWCLGGSSKNGSSKKCEFFDNISNLWKFGPPLNNSSIEASSFFLDPQEIYILGHSSLNVFEKLNITSLSNKWEIIQIFPPIRRNYGCTFQINRFELLLFGGDYFKKGN